MKLNFWQIVGAIIIVIAVIGIAYREISEKPAAPRNPASPATFPATR